MASGWTRSASFPRRGVLERDSLATMRRLAVSASLVAAVGSLLVAGCDKAPAGPEPTGAKPTPSSSSASAASTAPSTVQTGSAAMAAAASDAGAATKPTGKTIETPAGPASEVGTEIQLAGRTIYPPDCAAGAKDGCAKVKAIRSGMEGIKILRHFDGPGGARSILLLQATTAGNACNGGPLFFVRVAKDAPPVYSDVFDYCGGPDPMVGAMADKILVSAPAHKANRGSNMIPAQNMEYDIATGTLKTAAPAKKH